MSNLQIWLVQCHMMKSCCRLLTLQIWLVQWTITLIRKLHCELLIVQLVVQKEWNIRQVKIGLDEGNHTNQINVDMRDTSNFTCLHLFHMHIPSFPITAHVMNCYTPQYKTRAQNNGHLSQVIFRPILVYDRPNPIW